MMPSPWQVSSAPQRVYPSKSKEMPIEIRELLIRATITGGPATESTASPDAVDLEALKEQLVKEVSAEVIRQLKQKSER